MSNRIKVYCRVRPLTMREKQDGQSDNVRFLSNTMIGLSSREETFKFDEVFPEDTTQSHVFSTVG